MLGMRGTGSKNVDVDDLFVPEHLTMAQAAVQSQEAPGGRLHDAPIYRAPMMAFLPLIPGPITVVTAPMLHKLFGSKAVTRYRMLDFDHLSSRDIDHACGAFILARPPHPN